jgi:hypothetical protein
VFRSFFMLLRRVASYQPEAPARDFLQPLAGASGWSGTYNDQ